MSTYLTDEELPPLPSTNTVPRDYYTRDQLQEYARAAIATQPPAVQGEPNRPDILERLSYHALERDDLTLDECLAYLAKGWAKVHGRTERQMVMQILALLAGQAASTPSREVEPPRGVVQVCPIRDAACAEIPSAMRCEGCGIHSRGEGES